MSKIVMWVVTQNDEYYPCHGTGDWLTAEPSELLARAIFAGGKLGWGQTRYLISIDEDGHYEEVAVREADADE